MPLIFEFGVLLGDRSLQRAVRRTISLTFMVLRFLFGIGMGGEWGVGASLMMEKVSPRYRGLLSGLLQEGYSFGFLLASLAYALLYPFLLREFPEFGAWRILFFIGGLPALLAIFVRMGIKESEVWGTSRLGEVGELFRDDSERAGSLCCF